MVTSTEKVPNTSPTAASSGSDLNGQAIAAACATLRARMAPVASAMLGLDERTQMQFENGSIRPGGDAGSPGIPFADVARECWLRRVSLSATGFYATPGIEYDEAIGQGRPFFYYAYGGAVSEVEICTVTGEWRLLRVDILHDVGNSLVPNVDIGQIEGGFVQGLGWVGTEEVIYDHEGRLLTHGPSTYKIPAVGDVPRDFRVSLLDRASTREVIHGSKAVGEPPFMLALSVLTALRDAVRRAGGYPGGLTIPCTPEVVLRALAC
jgi:xanthine dehydrogenase molybdopterin-binding subunit B